MKFSMYSETLAKALKSVMPFIPTKSMIPIITGVRIIVKKNEMRLEGTDLENGISVLVDGDIKDMKDGSIVVNAEEMLNFLTKIKKEWMEVTVSKEKMKIVTQNGNYNFRCDSDKDYPDHGVKDKVQEVVIDKEIFNVINSFSFALSKDGLRSALQGYYFNGEQNEIVVTNGHQMVVYGVELPFEDTFIIQSKIVEYICKTVGKDEDINMSYDQGTAYFDYNGISIFSRLIDSDYPDYQGVIPEGYKFDIVLDKQFIESVDRVGMFADNLLKRIVVDFVEKTISATNNDGARDSASEAFSVEDDIKLQVGFNSDMISQILKSIDEEFHFRGNSPIEVFNFGSNEIKDVSYFLMPVRLEDESISYDNEDENESFDSDSEIVSQG